MTPYHVNLKPEIGLPPSDGRVAFPIEGSLSVEVMEKGTVVAQDEDPSQLSERLPQHLRGYQTGLRSFISAPVTTGDQVTAVIHFYATYPDAYGPNEVAFAEKIAGQISGAVAMARLYAEIERTQSELRESEERHRALLENNVDALAVVVDGLIEYANPALFRMFGWTETDLKGTSVLDYVVPEERSRARDRIESLEGGERSSHRSTGYGGQMERKSSSRSNQESSHTTARMQ